MSTKAEIENILKVGDLFLDLKTKLDKDLERSGFRPAQEPTFDEPRITENLSGYSAQELRDLYDRFIAYYDYLTDQIIRSKLYMKSTDSRLDTVQAKVMLEVPKHSELTNAELRKSWVLVHPAYLVAKRDRDYFRQTHDAQVERRSKLKAAMRRIYQELFFKGMKVPDGGDAYSGGSDDRAPQKREEPVRKKPTYKRIRGRRVE